MKKNYLIQAWLVLALAGCFGAVLAAIQVNLQPRIEQNKLSETYDQIPKLVRIWDEAGRFHIEADKDKTTEYVTDDGKVTYKVFGADGEHLGWVIRAAGQGFADRIELLIGLDAGCERITGMYVLDQKETPALGNKIVADKWRSQFVGRDARRAVVVAKTSPAAENNEIRAVTGATVSSQSVCDIVNRAVSEFRRRKSELKERQ